MLQLQTAFAYIHSVQVHAENSKLHLKQVFDQQPKTLINKTKLIRQVIGWPTGVYTDTHTCCIDAAITLKVFRATVDKVSEALTCQHTHITQRCVASTINDENHKQRSRLTQQLRRHPHLIRIPEYTSGELARLTEKTHTKP